MICHVYSPSLPCRLFYTDCCIPPVVFKWGNNKLTTKYSEACDLSSRSVISKLDLGLSIYVLNICKDIVIHNENDKNQNPAAYLILK